jgi:hypothetical protein
MGTNCTRDCTRDRIADGDHPIVNILSRNVEATQRNRDSCLARKGSYSSPPYSHSMVAGGLLLTS